MPIALVLTCANRNLRPGHDPTARLALPFRREGCEKEALKGGVELR